MTPQWGKPGGENSKKEPGGRGSKIELRGQGAKPRVEQNRGKGGAG